MKTALKEKYFDPDGPSEIEFAEDWVSDYRGVSRLSYFDRSEFVPRFVVLKTLERDESLASYEFIERLRKNPLIHKPMVGFYLQTQRPEKPVPFVNFIYESHKNTETENDLVLENAIKNFANWCFRDAIAGLYESVGGTVETIWVNPTKDWMIPNQELMANFHGTFNKYGKDYIQSQLNANEAVDFVYRDRCFVTGDPYSEALSASITKKVNEICRITIGDDFIDDAIGSFGALKFSYLTFSVIEKATQAVIFAQSLRNEIELSDEDQ